MPFPIPTRRKKKPLRATTRMIAAGESASGFFYFNIKHRPSARIHFQIPFPG